MVQDLKNTYHLIDSGNFQKLEQVGPYRIVRPSPQAVWKPRLPLALWDKADATFKRFSGGDGKWVRSNKKLPESWKMTYGQMVFQIRLTDFGHLGIFAEQLPNWERIRRLSQLGSHETEEFRVLNLFAYTGASSLAASQGGSHVVHVDASKTSVAWAREHAEINDLSNRPIRWIVDDAAKFVQKEIRRNRRYHGIILDPPSFGRGAKGEVWKIEEHLVDLLNDLFQILADDFRFVVLSSHSTGYTPLAIRNLLEPLLQGTKGEYFTEEMVIPEGDSNRVLPSGASCFFERSFSV